MLDLMDLAMRTGVLGDVSFVIEGAGDGTKLGVVREVKKAK